MISRDTPENCITNLNRYLKTLYLNLIKNSKKLKFEYNNYLKIIPEGWVACLMNYPIIYKVYKSVLNSTSGKYIKTHKDVSITCFLFFLGGTTADHHRLKTTRKDTFVFRKIIYGRNKCRFCVVRAIMIIHALCATTLYTDGVGNWFLIGIWKVSSFNTLKTASFYIFLIRKLFMNRS